jgi:uncharacterized protein YjbI with pentapeptide repeats
METIAMNGAQKRVRRTVGQFTLRTLLTLTLLVALLLAWRSSLERAEVRLTEQANKLRYAEEELERARDEIRDRDRVKPDKNRTLWQANLDGAQLRGVTISSNTNAFQRASLQGCDLAGATLQGGDASFQLSRFDNSRLVNAKLTGGVSSFQMATFVNADLAGAELSGGGASFQKSSFENATLIRSRLSGSFQSVNLSGTRLEGANLSALRSEDLASCYFKDPPTYDRQTTFPAGFDPAKKLWRRVGD